MQQKQLLGARLKSALPYITPGGRIADIGTDHAYLPIYLVQNRLVSYALASDVRPGPIGSARANIAAAGFSDRIGTLMTDGLDGVECFSPDDILIFGMGGELIVRILSRADWIRDAHIGLILQPMSRANVLREWLLQNGFAITGESLSLEEKYYQTIAARYCDRVTHYSPVELLVGRYREEERTPLFRDFVRHEIEVLERILAGKRQSECADISEDLKRKKCLEELL